MNLSSQTLYRFLRDDFAAAWDSMAVAEAGAGGNFLFFRQALAMLELTCRVCAVGGRLDAFAEHLAREDPRYFTQLPATARTPKEFSLPSSPLNGASDSQLIAFIYDLGRNGLAHQNQQILARISANSTFGFSVTGVGSKTLDKAAEANSRGSRRHLSTWHGKEENVWIVVRPEILFLHIDRAVGRAGVFSGGHDHEYLDRRIEASGSDLLEALRRGGHEERPVPRGLG